MSSGGLAVRRATTADLDALSDLARAAFSDPWTREQLAEELRAEASRVYLAEREGAPCGYAAVRRTLDALEVLSLGVAPAARREGVGRALCAAAVAAEPGLARVTLEVRESNAAALALYSRLGFRPVGRRPRYYPDGEGALLLEQPATGA